MTITGPAKLFIIGTLPKVRISPSVTGYFVSSAYNRISVFMSARDRVKLFDFSAMRLRDLESPCHRGSIEAPNRGFQDEPYCDMQRNYVSNTISEVLNWIC